MDAKAPPCEVRACRFVLVDEQDKERAVLELDNGEPVFQMAGLNGRIRVRIGIESNGQTRIFLEGTDIQSFVSIAAVSNGVATVEFGGSHRRIRASSNLAGTNPSIVLRDDNNNLVDQMP